MRHTAKMIRILIALPAVCTLCFMMGCGTDVKVKVESDTSWSGVFGGKSVNGSGNKMIDIPDEGRQCIQIQKNTFSGFVKTALYDAGKAAPVSDWKETKDAYGHLDFCWNL